MNIQDIISSSIGLLYFIPLILYNYTQNPLQLKGFIGLGATTIISETIKYVFIKQLSPRPKGATNCNLLCNDGNQEGRPGMPSSHSAEVVFFSAFYIQQTNNIIIKICLVVYAGLVMLSRYIKRCHTINQIGVGALLGLSLNYLVVRHL